jgi:Protein of unknown function (DUF642)/PEP-CTERM motif
MKKPMLVALALGWLTASAFAAPSILNPSFEQVQIGSPFYSSNPADIPGWTHSGTVGDALLWGIGYSDSGGNITVAGAGNQFVTLGGGYGVPGSASWTTTITGLTPGYYSLGFEIANEGEPPTQTMTATLSGGANATGTFTTTTGASLYYWKSWEQEYLDFTATGGNTTLTFSVVNQAFDMGLDNITLTPVVVTPEPGTLVMFGTGIVGIAGIIRRKFVA